MFLHFAKSAFQLLIPCVFVDYLCRIKFSMTKQRLLFSERQINRTDRGCVRFVPYFEFEQISQL